METSLILYAEHCFNASTFASRVSTATRTDIYSALTSAIGTLKGPLHGGANEWAMNFLAPIKSVEECDQILTEKLKKRELIFGFGHRVYKNGDPRSDIIKELSIELSKREGGAKLLLEVSVFMEREMFKRKKLHPNADFFHAPAYFQLGIPTKLFTPIFVMSRTAGWCAHIFEQRTKKRLIRPIAHYNGPEPREFLAMADRKDQEDFKL